MSNQAMTWAFKQEIFPTGAKFVLVTLANYATQEGYCYAKQSRIAADTGQDERTVRRHLSDLEDAGWITRERRTHKTGQRAADGFHLIGFGDYQPDNLAGSQPARMTASQPDNLAGSDDEPTGHSVRTNRTICPPPLKEVEPTIEPTIAEPSPVLRNGHRENRPNERWETMVSIHGFSPTSETPEHGRWNKAEGIWRKIHASTDDMHRAYRLYREKYPRAPDNALAVAGRAESLLHGNPPPNEYELPVWTEWKDA